MIDRARQPEETSHVTISALRSQEEVRNQAINILENFRNAGALNAMETAGFCLFKQYQSENRSLPDYQVWQKICEDVLASLGEQRFEHADLLRAMDIEQLSYKEMLDAERPKKANGEQAWTSPGGINNHKEPAISDFADLFWIQEETCRQRSETPKERRGST